MWAQRRNPSASRSWLLCRFHNAIRRFSDPSSFGEYDLLLQWRARSSEIVRLWQPVTPGGGIQGDLLMIPGPLGMRWRDRWFPRLETGELRCGNVATPYRVRRWVDLAPRIGTDSFIKLFTHGAQDRNSSALLQDCAGVGIQHVGGGNRSPRMRHSFCLRVADVSSH